MGMSDRAQRQRLSRPQAQTLEAAVNTRGRGWQYDRRTGDAAMILRPLSGTDPFVGCIAYVRPKPEGKGYESIVKGGRLTGYPGEWDTATEALQGVETWMQRNLMGVTANESASKEIERCLAWISAEFGDKAKGLEASYFNWVATHPQ